MRQKKSENCSVYTILNDNETDAKNQYCYDEFTENPEQTQFLNINNSILNDDLTYINWCENGTVFPDEICYTIPGLYRRNIEYYYTVRGEITNYDLSNGYYFDVPIDPALNYSKIMDYIHYYWWDLSSRLLVISFNAFQEDSDDKVGNPKIINLNFYIEQGATGIIFKNFEVFIFELFCNFLYYPNGATGFSITNLWNLIMIWKFELSYLMLVMIYALICLYREIKRFIEEGQMIIYNELGQFVVTLTTDGMVISCITLRLIFLVYQHMSILPYLENGFQNYFPVPYFYYWENNIRYIEMGMIVLILINSLNIFYFDFFGQIFLTLQNSIEKLTGYMIVFLVIVMSYSMGAVVMYGANLTVFSEMFKSFSTMLLFMNQGWDLYSQMIEISPNFSKIFILSYLLIVYFIIFNLVFAIFLDSYEYVKKKFVLTLLKYSIIWHGLRYFFENWYYRIKRKFENITKLKLPDGII